MRLRPLADRQSSISNPPSLTPGQYAAGFALVSVSINAAPWPDKPSNAVIHPHWTVYGVAEDTFWLPLTNWPEFPLTTGHWPLATTNPCEGLHVSSSGLVSFGNPLSTPDPAPLVWDDAAADTDGDGMGLPEELLHGLDPLTADAGTFTLNAGLPFPVTLGDAGIFRFRRRSGAGR